MKDCSRFISLIRLQEHPRHFVTHVENRAAEYRMELCKLHANEFREKPTCFTFLSKECHDGFVHLSLISLEFKIVEIILQDLARSSSYFLLHGNL